VPAQVVGVEGSGNRVHASGVRGQGSGVGGQGSGFGGLGVCYEMYKAVRAACGVGCMVQVLGCVQ